VDKGLTKLNVQGGDAPQIFRTPILAIGLDEIQIAVVDPERRKPRRLRAMS
jgi:hypothetical protein